MSVKRRSRLRHVSGVPFDRTRMRVLILMCEQAPTGSRNQDALQQHHHGPAGRDRSDEGDTTAIEPDLSAWFDLGARAVGQLRERRLGYYELTVE